MRIPSFVALLTLVLVLRAPFALAAGADGPDDAGASTGTPGEEGAKPTPPPKPEKKAPPKPPEYDQMPLAMLQKKADAGDLKAQFELGSRFNYGRELPKNTREALRWLRRAAQGGNTDAQRLLAVKLFEGHDVVVDHTEALFWALKLADTGDRPGQVMLGRMYANGEGTARDLVRAYMWFDIAATTVSGKPLAELEQKARDDAAVELDKTASLLQPGEITDAQQLASDWWQGRNAKKAAPKKKKAGKPAVNAPQATAAKE